METYNWKKPTEQTHKLIFKAIGDGFDALKKETLSLWPKEGEKIDPLYSDASATIYLKLVPKKWLLSGTRGKSIMLPSPLSYNRNVCWVTTDPDRNTWFKKTLQKMGVQGIIEVMHRKEVETLLSKNDRTMVESIEKLAATYDLIVAEEAFTYYFDKVLGKHAKSLSIVKLNMDAKPNEQLIQELAKSSLWENTSETAYMWRVGHIGQTDNQIKQNIHHCLKTIHSWINWFPHGLQHFKSVHLKIGGSKGVAIYVNRGEVMDEPARELRTADQMKIQPGKQKSSGDSKSEGPRKIQPKLNPLTPDLAGEKKNEPKDILAIPKEAYAYEGPQKKRSKLNPVTPELAGKNKDKPKEAYPYDTLDFTVPKKNRQKKKKKNISEMQKNENRMRRLVNRQAERDEMKNSRTQN